MEKYVIFLLIITPGFVCHLLYERLNTGRRITNPLDKTIIALLYSIGVLALNYVFINIIYNIHTLTEVKNYFDNIYFILVYIGISMISCIIEVLILHFIRPSLAYRIINKIRKTSKKDELGRQETVWDEVFHDGEKHAIIVEKDGVVIGKGFIKHLSFAHNEVKEIYLDQMKVVELRPDLFNELKGIYLDCKNNLIVKEYDLNKAYSEM